jgi:hypothetical protein
MDLGTLKRNMDQGVYQTFVDFDRHVQLIYTNCMKFNSPAEPYHTYAEKQKKQWAKYKLKYKDVDLKILVEQQVGTPGASGQKMSDQGVKLALLDRGCPRSPWTRMTSRSRVYQSAWRVRMGSREACSPKRWLCSPIRSSPRSSAELCQSVSSR